jgi:hypothetical protein
MRSATKSAVGKDPARLDWIRGLPCVACVGMESFLRFLAGTHTWGDVAKIHNRQRSMCEAAHIGVRGLSEKCPDNEAIPLCGFEHHREGKESVHKMGKAFWAHHGLDRGKLIAALNRSYDAL